MCEISQIKSKCSFVVLTIWHTVESYRVDDTDMLLHLLCIQNAFNAAGIVFSIFQPKERSGRKKKHAQSSVNGHCLRLSLLDIVCEAAAPITSGSTNHSAHINKSKIPSTAWLRFIRFFYLAFVIRSFRTNAPYQHKSAAHKFQCWTNFNRKKNEEKKTRFHGIVCKSQWSK